MAPLAVNGTNWMHSLDDKLSVSQLTMPGMHDSYCRKGHVNPGMATLGLNFVYTQFPEFDIPAQLNDGVRFFDFDGKLRHGSAELDSTLYEQLGHVVRFLQENDRETVLVSVKWEKEEISIWEQGSVQIGEPDGEAQKIVRALRRERIAHIPLLGEVRGQMVLLQRFGHSIPEGIRYDPGSSSSANAPAAYNGQDNYDLTAVMDPNASDNGLQRVQEYKFSKCVKPHLESARKDWIDKTLWINCLSGYAGKPPGFHHINPDELAFGVNAMLKEYLQLIQKRPQRLGLLLLDFADVELVKEVWGMNFEA